jgi:23S rRNA (uracil1939-C5)-methyltransferase
MHQKRQLEVIIEKFSEKGLGIAFENKNKILIPNAVIGDKVLVELSKKSKGYIKGKILKILEPSIFRCEPKCSHFEICGGCKWQNLKYDEQLKQKENFVINNFDKHIKNAKFYPIEKCENNFEYRNKMEFSFSENQKKTKFLGLVMQTGRFVIDVERCYLSNLWFSLVLKQVKMWWEKYNFTAFNFRNGEGFLRTLTIKEGKNTKDKMVILTTSDSTILTKEQRDDFVLFVKNGLENNEENLSIYLNTQKTKKGIRTSFELEKLFGKDFITEDLYIETFDQKIKLSFQIGPFSFFQPNTYQAQKLYSLAINYLKEEDLKDKLVFDFYAGTGTIGMILAKFAKKVLAIELNEDAYNQALKNAKLNEIKNFEIINEDVSKILREIVNKKDFEKPHILVVDPPRAGLADDAVDNILKLSPKIILYISCNVKTQVENINKLTEFGYQLIILHPVDQFPHTFHIENIAILKRA